MSSNEMQIGDRLMQSLEAERFREDVRFPLQRLQGLPQTLADLCAGTRSKVAQVWMDESLTPKARADRAEELRNAALKQVDAALAAAQADLQTIERSIDKAVEPTQSGDATERLLRETQLGRVWARQKGQLDNLPDAYAVLRAARQLLADAASQGDAVAVQALREELPSYLKTRRMTDPGLADELAQAEMPFLSGAARAARQLEGELQVAWPRILAGFQMARRDLTGQSRLSILPGWREGERIPL
jgi:hypothetical protein